MHVHSLHPKFMGSSLSTTNDSETPTVARLIESYREGCDFNTFYDAMKRTLSTLSPELKQQFISYAERFVNDTSEKPFLRAVVSQLASSLLVADNDRKKAMDLTADALGLLAEERHRKDEAFLEVLGSLLYDLAWIHAESNEYKAAERTLKKAIKVFEKLNTVNQDRYGSSMIYSVNSVTSAFSSRMKQASMLAHYQVATGFYTEMLNEGTKGALSDLVNSLSMEATTLQEMGKYRESIPYYTKALKFLTKSSPDFTLRHLQLSIGLGKSLLNGRTTRSKGVHLLNTMLQKATTMKAEAEKSVIETLLDSESSRRHDIFNLWYKLFPR